jgi:hypothetical protein
MHTLHPYAVNFTASINILHPVVVSSSMSLLFYEDVALVEPGLDGAPFGTDDFHDFVVMEASKNGIDWVALEDGYDARLHPEWLTSYTANIPGSRPLLRQHQVDLRNQFAAGDTLLFRYRLYSNATITGWGAALDYVVIQDEPTGVEGSANFHMAIFPNPAKTDFTVRYQAPYPSSATVVVSDLNGREVASVTTPMRKEGIHEIPISARGLPNGVYVVRLSAAAGYATRKIVVWN